MPHNIVVLSVEPVLDNPIALIVCLISLTTVIICIVLFILFCIFGFWFDADNITDIVSNIAMISLYTVFISAFFGMFEYHDTGLKKYSVIAQTEEQIKYIYDNYDIVDSDGNIYYIEEKGNNND